MEGAAEDGLEVAQQGVDPAELGQFGGVLAAGDDSLVVAVGRGHRPEACQAIGEHGAAGRQVPSGPLPDRLGAEPAHRCDPGVNRMAGLVQGNRRNDRNLVLRSPARLATRAFSAEVGIIHLDLSLQQVDLLPIRHGPQDLVVEQPGRVVLHAQMAAELQRRDPSLGLADQIESQEPGCQRQLGGLHDRAGREGCLMAAGSALVALEPAAVDQAVLLSSATRASEAIGPAGFLQSRLTLLLRAVQPLERQQRQPFLKLDAVARHDLSSTCVPAYVARLACAERAG